MTLPPLPKPFAALPVTGSQTTSIYVWTSDAMKAYAIAAVAAERESIAQLFDAQHAIASGSHNYWAWAAREIRARPNVADKRHGTVLRGGSA